jgi:hypothetical protein
MHADYLQHNQDHNRHAPMPIELGQYQHTGFLDSHMPFLACVFHSNEKDDIMHNSSPQTGFEAKPMRSFRDLLHPLHAHTQACRSFRKPLGAMAYHWYLHIGTSPVLADCEPPKAARAESAAECMLWRTAPERSHHRHILQRHLSACPPPPPRLPLRYPEPTSPQAHAPETSMGIQAKNGFTEQLGKRGQRGVSSTNLLETPAFLGLHPDHPIAQTN